MYLTSHLKPTLFKQAVELGALSVNAFTDRVTHLVAGNHGGAKYTVSSATWLETFQYLSSQCALQRKIPILQPSWITENYQIWLRGDDVDLDEVRQLLLSFYG
jgi:DNA replication regulator DPB11